MYQYPYGVFTVVESTCILASFPGLPTVFDCLQYAKMEGRSGSIYHMKDANVTKVEKEVGIEKTHFTHAFFILNNEQ